MRRLRRAQQPHRGRLPEDGEGVVHVSYDTFAGVMAPYGNAGLDKVAGVIDGVLEQLESAAVAS